MRVVTGGTDREAGACHRRHWLPRPSSGRALPGPEPETRLRLLCRSSVPAAHDPAIEVVRGDVADAASVLRAMDGVDQVYHLAGPFPVAGPIGKPSSQRTSRGPGMSALPPHAIDRAPGVRLDVWHHRRLALPDVHDEGAAYPYTLVSRWPYYLSKIFGEKLALHATAEHGLPTVVVNPTLVLGPCGGRPQRTGDRAIAGRPSPVCLRGGLSFVDVRDMAAILPVAADPGAGRIALPADRRECELPRPGESAGRARRRPARGLPVLPTPLVRDVARALGLLPFAARSALLAPAEPGDVYPLLVRRRLQGPDRAGLRAARPGRDARGSRPRSPARGGVR